MKSKRLHYISRITKLLLETDNPKMKVDDIAFNLGITKKTIYNYFDSKQHMIECVLDTYLKNKVEEIKELLQHNSNSISSLIIVGHSIGPIFRDCSHLVEQKGAIVNSNRMLQIFMERRKELVNILALTFKKGIRERLIESDIDAELASQVYLSGVETLFKKNGLLSSKAISSHQISEVLFYMIKGCCTPIGLNILREKVDIRVLIC